MYSISHGGAASGSFNSIVGRGSIKAFPALSLLYILHVPQLPLNLVSVSSLTKTYNRRANFLFFVFFFHLDVSFRT